MSKASIDIMIEMMSTDDNNFTDETDEISCALQSRWVPIKPEKPVKPLYILHDGYDDYYEFWNLKQAVATAKAAGLYVRTYQPSPEELDEMMAKQRANMRFQRGYGG